MNKDRRRIKLKPLALSAWMPAAVRVNNLLLNKTDAATFDFKDERVFRLSIFPYHQTQNVYPISMTLGIGDSTAGLWLSDWPLLDHIRAFIPEGMLTRLPENLGIALTENAMDDLIQVAENALGIKIKIQSLSAEPENHLDNLPLGFELLEGIPNSEGHGQTRLIAGVLKIEEQLYPLLQERMRYWPSTLNEDWEKLETNAYLEIGETSVSIQDINTFNVSDVILIDNTSFKDEGLLRLRFNNQLYCGAQLNTESGKSLTITTQWNTMADNESNQNVNQINQIPVQLSFDLGQKSLSFNEVKQLRPGYVIDLSQNLPEVVHIRAQNKLIGTGELVDISGRVGVRILSLFGTRSK